MQKEEVKRLSRIIGKFGIVVQSEAGPRLTVLSREHGGYKKHPFTTTQGRTLSMDISRW